MCQRSDPILWDSACCCLGTRASKTGEKIKQMLILKIWSCSTRNSILIPIITLVPVLQETKEGVPDFGHHQAQGRHGTGKRRILIFAQEKELQRTR